VYPQHGGMHPQMDGQLIRDIEKAINGEYSAINCYEQLVNNAPNEEEREVIREIREDEIRHFQEFSRIYMSLTGRQPSPKMTEECPKQYRRGLRAAFVDEQETVDFYLDIAEKAQIPFISNTFKRAASDEQQHAVWFSFFYNQRTRD
jgi:rubrerythrin